MHKILLGLVLFGFAKPDIGHTNERPSITLAHTVPKTPEQLRLLDNLLDLDCTIDGYSITGFFLCDHGKTNIFFIFTDVESWPGAARSNLKSCPQSKDWWSPQTNCGMLTSTFSNYQGTTVRFTRNSHGHVFYTVLESTTGKTLVKKTYVPIDKIKIEIEDRLLK